MEESPEEKIYPFKIQFTVRVTGKNTEEALQALGKITSKLEKIDKSIQDILPKGLKSKAQIVQHVINIDI